MTNNFYTTTPQRIDALTAEVLHLADSPLRGESTRRLQRLNAVVQAVLDKQVQVHQRQTAMERHLIL